MTTDAWGHKEEGKERIQAALFGLMLALGSYVIIATIDESILDINFNVLERNKLSAKNQFELNVPDAVIEADLNSSEWITNRGTAEQPTGIGPMTNIDGTSGLRQPGESAADAILRNARAAANPNTGLHTCNISGTSGGKRACAYAVNEIVESALGQPITNSLSTADMYQKLKSNNYFEEVSGGVSNSKAGDIIISPTANGKTGHVGIINADGGASIISNSSSQGKVLENYNAARWSKYYEQRQGLNTYVYRPR